MWGGSIKIGATLLGLGRVCFGDFKYQHCLPEIAYSIFTSTSLIIIVIKW